jgi:hypothetical protein
MDSDSMRNLYWRLVAVVVLPLFLGLIERFYYRIIPESIWNVIFVILVVSISSPPTNVFRLLRQKRINAIEWEHSILSVKARLIPKYVWTTASIDVVIDGRCVLETGGQLRTRGEKRREFTHNNATHVAILSWTPPRSGLFYPYELSLDDQIIDKSEVYIGNWPLGIVGVILIVGTLLGIPLFVALRW